MKKTKWIALFMVMFMFLCFLTGCSALKYSATMYSKSESWVLPSFLEENHVKAFYKNPNYDATAENPRDEYYYDESAPSNRTFIIDNQEDYSAIYGKGTLDVDFEKQVVYLYIFSDIYPGRKYYIDDIKIKNEQLNIYYKLEECKETGSTAPFQRCFTVIMQKTDTTSVAFIKRW